MASPVGGLNQGSGEQEFKARVQQWIRDEIRAAAAGGNGLHVDGATGDLVADRGQFRSDNYVPGTSGWGMKPNGNAEFNDLTIRGGIIGNDALTSPVVPQSIYNHTVGFALSAFATTIKTVPVTVPVGCTSAAVLATSRIYAINPTASADRIVAWTTIAGIGADGLPSDLAPASGGSVVSISPMTKTVTGLIPGGTLNITVEGGSYSANWAANASNTMEITALILWFR